jgi:3-phenylpropionate/cinnamic acid dioxygenase small subunit
MTDPDLAEIRALLDKQAITEILMRYSRLTDRKDFAGYASQIYWPDAVDDHVLYQGEVTGLMEFAAGFTQDMPTMHFLGNILIELQDDTHAFAETYHMAYHNMPAEPVRDDLMLMGRYLDKFEKRGREWRIKQRTVVVDHYTRGPATSVWNSGLFENIRMRGMPKPHDPLYQLHPEPQKA